MDVFDVLVCESISFKVSVSDIGRRLYVHCITCIFIAVPSNRPKSLHPLKKGLLHRIGSSDAVSNVPSEVALCGSKSRVGNNLLEILNFSTEPA